MDIDNRNRNMVFAGGVLAVFLAAALSSAFESRPQAEVRTIEFETHKEHSTSKANEGGTGAERLVGDFDRVLVKGGYELQILPGDYQVFLTGPESHIPHVTTYVENGQLVLDTLKSRDISWKNVDIEITIRMPELRELDIVGAIDGDISGVFGDKFDLFLRGAGDLDLKGDCKSIYVEISGAGDVDAENMKCEDVKVVMSGAGNLEAYASNSFTGKVSGVGNIDVYGNPKEVQRKISGLGVIDIH